MEWLEVVTVELAKTEDIIKMIELCDNIEIPAIPGATMASGASSGALPPEGLRGSALSNRMDGPSKATPGIPVIRWRLSKRSFSMAVACPN